jgi:hypothetical protein
MKERAQARLAALKQEYLTGESQLRELMQQEVSLRETLLRISGAIQVLEEVLDETPADRPEHEEKAESAHDGTRLGAGAIPETIPDPRPPQPEVLTVP